LNKKTVCPAVSFFVEARIGIRLHQAGIGCKVSARMHAAAISRVEERHRRRGSSGKRAVVAHASPQAAGSAFALGQHRHPQA
jgi:hypothetical protein